MAKRTGRRSGGDRVLESRHLIGLFVGVVLLCAVFFSLGYVMGKSQYGGSVHAAYLPPHTVVPVSTEKVKVKQEPSVPPGGGEWDFYANKGDDHLEPAPAPKAAAPAVPQHTTDRSAPFVVPLDDRKPARATTQPARFVPPKNLSGAVTLQVAAVTRQGDALAMADALQRKKFRSFVLAPSSDNFYRVQVGPYPDERTADAARSDLDRAGFKSIVKR